MDALDLRIVREMGLRPYGALPRDPEEGTGAAIARRLGVDLKTVKARIDRMEEGGMLRGQQIVPNLRHLGLEGAAYLYRIEDPDRKAEALRRVEPIEGLMEIHDFIGEAACVDVAYRSAHELSAKLRLVGEFTGDPAPTRFYDRTMPAVGRDLTPLDWRILRGLRGRARRPLSEVADEIGVSLKTVRRRYDRMAEEGSFFVVPLLDPGAARGLVLFELLVYTSPDAAASVTKDVLGALEDHYVYHYVPSSRSLGNFDVLLFADSMGAVEALRQRARTVAGVARVDSLVFQGWRDYSGWLDARIEELAVPA